MSETSLLAAQFIAALLMVGIIWFVQIVHYPLMAHVGPECFGEYSRRHQMQTTWVVMGPMLLEAAAAAALVTWHPVSLLSPALACAIGLLLAIWVSTAACQVPLHARLSRGYDARSIRLLVASNWIRTAAWTARAVLLGVALSSGL